MDIEIKTIQGKKDTRGTIFEFLTAKDLKKEYFGHLFVATFDSTDAIRGNHYHKTQHEFYLVVSGKVKVILVDIHSKKRRSIIMSSRNPARLRIGPHIAHAAYSLTPSAVLLSYFKLPYNAAKPDATYYEVLSKTPTI